MNQQDHNQDTENFSRPPDVAKILDEFLQTTKRFEASADDLVRARVSSSLVVEDIQISDPKLDPELRKRIEAAVVAAVNAAFRKAVLSAGEILTQAPRQPYR
ncbi:MAG TPA: YbaB/EbfC family nucleoid-associated protein [Nitrospira sp.]|nr:YbaB/EbfC family nucleoid-associated protein [Nitrospira sp.]